MKYFICSEDPECIPYVQARNIDEAKVKMCTLCIEASPDDFECDGPDEVSESQIVSIKKAKAEAADLLCVFDECKCRICGCTDDNACPDGCYWIEEDLCSACADLVDQIVRTSVPVYDVLLERAKQIKKYGFDADHDDTWAHSELKYAAAVYLKDDPIFNYWPWRDFPYQGKKDTERQRLITAAALIIAEIERLDRAEDNKEEQ